MLGQITQYVLKVHGRCDLACDHCYVYEHADQSWRRKPPQLAPRTATSAAERIAEHAARHRLPQVSVILHGGEPLLAGVKGMQTVLDALVNAIVPIAALDLRVHTNGVRLDEEWCRLFKQYGVRIGISLDGDKAANDRHRRYANGRSSYQQVRRALALLRRPEYRELYAGILCTIDIDNDPIAVYEALLGEEPPNLDFLLPHATWDDPPKRPGEAAASYGPWLIRIYRRWVTDGQPVRIRIFDSLISATQGEPSRSETVGLEPVDLLVVDTDGSWEQPDSLKTSFNGAPDTGLGVFSHPVDQVIGQAGFVTRLGGLDALCAVCRECEFVRACGGGLYAHRYRTGTGFDNPTVYCADMMDLIRQITKPTSRRLRSARADVSRRPAGSQNPPADTHRLSAEDFDALAAGPGTVAAIVTLADMQLSFTKALVTAVAKADARWADDRLHAAMDEGWELLCAIDSARPEVVTQVLRHPFVLAWAERCLRPPAGSDRDLDRAHLAGVAAAAAILAGRQERVLVPVRNGSVYVPTVGALRLSAIVARTVAVSTGSDRIAVDGHRGSWQPTRRLTGNTLTATFEDLDPFRDCLDWPAAARRTAPSWARWQIELTAAGDRLAAGLPGYAGVLNAGLRSIVPLRRGNDGDRSSTAARAFGAVGVAPSHLAQGLDALLLHEFQHVKLHALTNLHDLFDPADTSELPVPWRTDRRPVEGALHGAYAHLALTHLWQARGEPGRKRYMQYRSWTRSVADRLFESPALTADGRRFVAGLRAATEPAAAADE